MARFNEPSYGYGRYRGSTANSVIGWDRTGRLTSAMTMQMFTDKSPVGEYAPQYVPWRAVWSGGIRYDMSDAVALKFEMGHEADRDQQAFIGAALQVAFTF